MICTLLLKNDFSPKAVSKLMGHAKEIISVDVYGDNANIIPDEIPELVDFMDEVLPKESEGEAEQFLDVVADTSYYLGSIAREVKLRNVKLLSITHKNEQKFAFASVQIEGIVI